MTSPVQLPLFRPQRWCEGRESYRPVGETIVAREYDVAEIPDDTTAKRFVVTHHYAKTFCSARTRFGLYRLGQLVGVAVLSTPMHPAVLTNVFRGLPLDTLAELGRFVLLDEVPANGETWFLGQLFRIARRLGYLGLVSFSDDVARTTVGGLTVHWGHTGTIYRAHNARYLGRADARTLRLLPDGRSLVHRVVTKIRNGERGWRAAAAQLEPFGAGRAPEDLEERREWLATWLPLLTRPLRHPGCHRFAWVLDRRRWDVVPPAVAFPRAIDFGRPAA